MLRPISRNFWRRSCFSVSPSISFIERSDAVMMSPAASMTASFAAMRATHRFGNDAVDDLEIEQILCGDAHVGSGILGAGRIVPEDRRSTFGRDHRIDRMLKHIDAVCNGDGDCATRTAFTDDDRDDRNAQPEALCRRAGNGFGLTAFLGADTG